MENEHRETARRRRKAAGYHHVSGYAKKPLADGLQEQLKAAEEVDREIEGKSDGSDGA